MLISNSVGTVTLNSGTNTVGSVKITDGTNTASVVGTALKIDGSAVTQPISGTVTATQSTASNLNATVVGLGTAGSPSGGIISIQGVSSGTPVAIANNTIINSGNSTTTPLGANATFTGTSTDVLGYTQVSIFVYSDVASATGGLNIQFSINGTNWDEDQAVTVSAANAQHISVPIICRYFRIIYINGPTLQTTFRLQTILKSISSSGTVGNIESLPVMGDTALRTQSILVGKSSSGSGTYLDVKVNPSGSLTADVTGSTVGLVAGTASIGTVGLNAGANTIGSVNQAGTWTVQPGNTPNTTPWLTTINQGGNSAAVTASNALKVDGSAVTQPISGTVAATQSGAWTTTVTQATAANLNATVIGTVTANIGTSGSLALDATLTGGTQRSRITDGTNNAAVKAASTAAVATDPALVVAISPNNTVAATQSGSWTTTVNQATAANLNATVVGSGNFTVVQSTASNLKAQVTGTGSAGTADAGVITIQGIAGMTAVKVDGSGVTQPVSGTVSISNSFALDATLTGGTQRSRITDGTNNAAVKAASTSAQATDTSLVVALHPSSPLPSGSNTVGGFKLIDTAGTNVATVKAGSAGAAYTDTAIVVTNRASGTVVSGVVTLSTTSATQFNSNLASSIGVWVSAPLNNTVAVYIGSSSVTSGQTGNGIELMPGDREFFPVANLNILYAITATTTQYVHYMVL